jgi:hypothetical protein
MSRTSLECARLVGALAYGSLLLHRLLRQVAANQSGDKSTHSKESQEFNVSFSAANW